MPKMSHNCDDALERMYLYLDGELTAESSEAIRVHLDDCPPCLDAFHFEERLKIVVRTRLQEEVPSELMMRLKAIIRSDRLSD
jgi:mycothiol system anti-sigma-R factor